MRTRRSAPGSPCRPAVPAVLGSSLVTSPLRFLVLVAVGTVACGGSQATPPPVPPPPTEASASPGPLTAAKCTELGGEVVGDIGDGAIHRPGYTCPKSGKAPLGKIAMEPGKPVAIEGAVCCK